MVDSGDLLFLQHVCHKSFSPSQMRRCYTHQFYKKALKELGYQRRYRLSDWDSVGLIVRNKEGARVLFEYYGETFDMDYDEFLRLPFLKDISLRRLKTTNPSIGYVSESFRNEVKDVVKTVEESWPKSSMPVFRDGVDIVLNYWVRSGIGDSEKMKDSLKQTVEDVNKAEPALLAKGIAKYSQPIIIRTEHSRQETKNY